MNRKFFARKSGYRDASLIILAFEGEVTERVYFDGIRKMEKYKNSKIHIELLEREDKTKSAPDYVIMELDKFKKKYKLDKEDELWMIIDFDRWGISKLQEIATKCVQKKYKLCVSNQRFELWLLLHFLEIENKDIVKWKGKFAIETFLKKKKAYNKNKEIDFEKYSNKIDFAIKNAKALDINPNDRWPQEFGTRVYRIIESIKKYSN